MDNQVVLSLVTQQGNSHQILELSPRLESQVTHPPPHRLSLEPPKQVTCVVLGDSREGGGKR